MAEYEYELIELTEDEIEPFFEKKEFKAINVTIPYKQTVIPYLDEVSGIAERIGAVNTIVNQDGKLYGYNTDYYGMKALLEKAEAIASLGQAEASLVSLRELEPVQDYSLRSMDLSTGIVCCSLMFPQTLFYEILSSKAGIPIHSDGQLLSLLGELAAIRREYDKISDALSSVKATGYGVVMPTAQEMKLETPELMKKGGAYGVKLRAGAPSIHMVRVDIDTEISPMVGDEKQSQDLIGYLSGEAPEKLWESNIFGKSVYDLIQEGLTAKIVRLPEDVRGKFRGTLTRIVNEGATGLICLIL